MSHIQKGTLEGDAFEASLSELEEMLAEGVIEKGFVLGLVMSIRQWWNGNGFVTVRQKEAIENIVDAFNNGCDASEADLY